ncbi:DUF602-domain-containing protein [Xylariaceae sp. FL0662B]|nr:DUF602-domain-containing protein [Xylariaceae sp. FL0662B]
MGNDGGSIPKRRELVKEAARAPNASELKATALESLTHAWTTCPLSSQPLDPSTTVSDWRGRLYNYEAILQGLVVPSSSSSSSLSSSPADGGGAAAAAAQQDEAFRRTGIKSVRDVVKLRFALRKDERGRTFRSCPVSLKELGAATRSVYIVPCGHVFAEAAMREMPEDETRCPECSEPFAPRDVIPILPADKGDEIERLTRRAEELRTLGLSHSLKKEKGANGKNKKRKAESSTKEKEKEKKDDKTTNGGETSKEDKDPVGKTDKGKDSNGKAKNDISSRINNSMTASLTAKVLAEQEERHKRRKIVDGYKRSETVR